MFKNSISLFKNIANLFPGNFINYEQAYGKIVIPDESDLVSNYSAIKYVSTENEELVDLQSARNSFVQGEAVYLSNTPEIYQGDYISIVQYQQNPAFRNTIERFNNVWFYKNFLWIQEFLNRFIPPNISIIFSALCYFYNKNLTRDYRNNTLFNEQNMYRIPKSIEFKEIVHFVVEKMSNIIQNVKQRATVNQYMEVDDLSVVLEDKVYNLSVLNDYQTLLENILSYLKIFKENSTYNFTTDIDFNSLEKNLLIKTNKNFNLRVINDLDKKINIQIINEISNYIKESGINNWFFIMDFILFNEIGIIYMDTVQHIKQILFSTNPFTEYMLNKSLVNTFNIGIRFIVKYYNGTEKKKNSINKKLKEQTNRYNLIEQNSVYSIGSNYDSLFYLYLL